LRSAEDRDAIKKAIEDGTLIALPHIICHMKQIVKKPNLNMQKME
jgi:hypothetical protein